MSAASTAAISSTPKRFWPGLNEKTYPGSEGAIRRLEDLSSLKSDYAFWMTKFPEERIEAVELLRRQYHGDSARLQRSARVVQQEQR
jgi:hypothetical protein